MDTTIFKQQLHEWNKKACNYCYDLVYSQIINAPFYAFQSEPIQNPEVLILGLNPAEGCGFPKDTYHNLEQYLTLKFSKANPEFEPNKDTWRIWQGLTRIFKYGNMIDKLSNDKFMYMNLLYFATPKFSDFQKKDKNNEIFNKCKDFTIELITNIIKPKNIVCLSINECYNRSYLSESETIIPSFLTYGKWNDIPVYGIRHTSYGNSGEKVVGECLNYLFNKTNHNNISETTKEVQEKFANQIKDIKSAQLSLTNDLYKHIISRIKEEFKLTEEKDKEYSLLINKDLIIRISDKKQGTIGIRHLNYNGAKKYTDTKDFYPNQTELLKLFENNNKFNKSEVWLGNITLKDLGKIEEDVVLELFDILKNVFDEINNIYK